MSLATNTPLSPHSTVSASTPPSHYTPSTHPINPPHPLFLSLILFNLIIALLFCNSVRYHPTFFSLYPFNPSYQPTPSPLPLINPFQSNYRSPLLQQCPLPTHPICNPKHVLIIAPPPFCNSVRYDVDNDVETGVLASRLTATNLSFRLKVGGGHLVNNTP